MNNIKKNKKDVAFLVPAYNEETVISSTIESLFLVASKEDIYVVDDGSKDKTAKVARKYKVNVVTIKNGGKANAISAGIKKFDLIKRYKYLMPVDADTMISSSLPSVVRNIFKKDKKKKIVAVVCKVSGRDTSMTTSYRMWEYEISQLIYKSAQSEINAITVNPGCSTVYRSELFGKIAFPKRTMTEDMDMTFMIHRKKLGKIVYTSKAEVKTQDPKTIREFIKQIDRWYAGFWQCILHHKVPWGGQLLDIELSLLGMEGVFNGLLSTFLAISIPFILIYNPSILLYPFLVDFIFFMIPTLAYTAFIHKSLKVFIYSPMFYFMRIMSGVLFLRSFLRVVIGIEHKKEFVWDTARYAIEKGEKAWANQTS
jgi:cellulose synthase/poly-beta-1,6-N-acetylglucosamine synthase-like glycosyltransferase